MISCIMFWDASVINTDCTTSFLIIPHRLYSHGIEHSGACLSVCPRCKRKMAGCQNVYFSGCGRTLRALIVFLAWRHHLQNVNKSSDVHFETFLQQFAYLCDFPQYANRLIILKKDNRQFTLTSKKALHLIFKGCCHNNQVQWRIGPKRRIPGSLFARAIHNG